MLPRWEGPAPLVEWGDGDPPPVNGIVPLRDHFVGRLEELAALREAFDRAAGGQTTMVALVGEVGIGRSRLVAEMLARTKAMAGAIAIGPCLERVRAPFLTLNEVLCELGLGAETGDLLTDDDVTDSGPTKERLIRRYHDLARLLLTAPARRPYIVAIEDVHWSDAATLGLFEYLAVARLNGPLLVILTLDSEAIEPGGRFSEAYNRLRSNGLMTIRLRALNRSETGELISFSSPAHLPRTAVERIKDLSEGNPLFATELLRTALEEGPDALARAAFSSIRSIVLGRFYQLSTADQNILQCASVVGRVFDPTLVATLTDRSLVDVLAGLRRARNLLLIYERRTPTDGSIAFSRALFCDIIYRELFSAEVKGLHTNIAEALEAEAESCNHVADLAYHWSAAGNDAKALLFAERAGDNAAALAAYEDAARYYDQALGRVEPGTRAYAALAEKRAYAAYAAGVVERTAELFSDALTLYAALGDRDKVIQMQIFLSRQAWTDGKTEDGLLHALRAVELIGDGDVGRKNFALAMAASYAIHLGRSDQAIELASRAQAPFLADIEARFLDTKAIAHARCGEQAASFAALSAAQNAADVSGDPDLIVRVYSNSADVAAMFGRTDDTLRWWAHAVGSAQRGQYIGRMAYAALGHALALLGIDDPNAAQRLYAVAAGTGVSNSTVLMLGACVGASLRALGIHGGALLATEDEALGMAIRSREPLRIGQVGAVLATAALLERRIQCAHTILSRAIDVVEAAPFAEDLLALTSIFGEPRDQRKARAILETAARRRDNIVARAAYDTTIAYDRTDHTRATALGAAADRWKTFGRSGIARLLASVAEGRMRQQAVRHGSMLTRREREIAQLVADGLSNRSIGERLSISERTVEHHVSSLLSRLGIRSRLFLTPELLESSEA